MLYIKNNSYETLANVNKSMNYFIVFNYLHQYAEGITGANRITMVLLGTDLNGFKTKADAKKYFTSVKKKYKSITTQENRGYGALGQFYSSPKIIKGSEVKADSSYHTLSFQA